MHFYLCLRINHRSELASMLQPNFYDKKKSMTKCISLYGPIEEDK